MAGDTTTPRVAVVGCGPWGANLVRVFGQLGALAAVSDLDLDVATKAGAAAGAPARSLDSILQDETIDALVIATPAATHGEMAKRALSADKHIFVEKPLALDLDVGTEVAALAETRGRVLMVGHLMRYHPAFSRLERLVADGGVGRLLYLYSTRANLGRFRREEDSLWSFAPHDISMMLALVGAEPTRVSAEGSCFLHPDIADVTTTHLSFPGGEHGHVFVSWLHPFKEQKLVVVGDAGMAVLDDGLPWEQKLQLFAHRVEWRDRLPEPVRSEAIAVPLEADATEPLLIECSHFLDCVSSGRTPLTDAAEGMRVLNVLSAARASLAEAGTSRTNELASRASGAHDVVGRASGAHKKPGVFVHPTACIDEPVEIGAGTRIWHFSHVMSGARIGRECSLGQNVLVAPGVAIGDGCKIQNNVSIFEGVELGDYVFCGPSCVFTNVTNPRAEIPRREEFQPTKVGRGATIGANATIVCGNSIGTYAFVAAGAVVTRDVPDHALVVGNPAKRIGWMSRAGGRLDENLVCLLSGEKYREIEGRIELIEP